MTDKRDAKMSAEPAQFPHPGSRLVEAFNTTIEHLSRLTQMMTCAADNGGEAQDAARALNDELTRIAPALKAYDRLMTDEYSARPNPWGPKH